ncbi:hypothetical protein ACFVTT_12840 [Streptomyces niveus]|uniref:hypothetical protein n=1 Tax=Streptomyces niveus TaxID=193462 RepID=UPI0034255FDF
MAADTAKASRRRRPTADKPPHETRTSPSDAGERASEAVAAVTDLRRDVDRLHHGLAVLREDAGSTPGLGGAPRLHRDHPRGCGCAPTQQCDECGGWF